MLFLRCVLSCHLPETFLEREFAMSIESRVVRTDVRNLAFLLPFACAATLSGIGLAIEPANPDLIPEARRVLEYVISIEGEGILTGVQRTGPGSGPLEAVLHMSGREPAVYGTNFSGFHHKDSDRWHGVMRKETDSILFWWEQKGAIITSLSHWGNPMHPDGTAWKNRPEGSVPPDIGRMATPGTDGYDAFPRDLGFIADYLQELAEARVPIFWTPLHEIDGGWFWWTDTETPENTAALYRLMFDYLVNERGLHNLIWVYHAAHRSNIVERRAAGAARRGEEFTLEDEEEWRRRFYPGDEYVDIAGLSAYYNQRLGWGPRDARQPAYELMRGVVPGKPLAVIEEPEPLNPDMAQSEGVGWLWARAWYVNAPANWIHYVYNHGHMITLDELPVLHQGNVMPNIRIVSPSDTQFIDGEKVEFTGFVSDRNDNLDVVEIYALSEPKKGGPWLNWSRRPYDDVMRQVEQHGTLLGEIRAEEPGNWTFIWDDVPAGYHQIIALARDTGGALAYSNVVRLRKGVENLALGRPVEASSHDAQGNSVPENAVDGNPYTHWSADREEREECQWILVDLGEERTVGAMSVLWERPYPQDYWLEVSSDGEVWQEAARLQQRGFRPHGISEVVRFDPVSARYVRLLCSAPQQNWATYILAYFSIYESLPE